MTEQTAKQRASQMILIVPLGSPPDTTDGEPVSELWAGARRPRPLVERRPTDGLAGRSRGEPNWSMPKTCSWCGLEKPLSAFYKQAVALKVVADPAKSVTAPLSEPLGHDTPRFKSAAAKR
jgi:hypothetical protein